MTRVLIISHDRVGRNMAGPGIRHWELSRVLAPHCAVTLAVPGGSALHGDGFSVQPYRLDDWDSLKGMTTGVDVVMPCGFTHRHFPQLAQLGCPIIVDSYDPYPAEALAMAVRRSPEEHEIVRQDLVERIWWECQVGDFFLCASERQRYWWLGALAAHGRLNAATYGADPRLRNLIEVVPFGCRSEPPVHTRQVLKGVLPGIAADDRIVLWGGGIWEWMDPLTLLHALRQVVKERPNVKLVFPGTRHPSEVVPEMTMHRQAVALASELGLLDTYAFFGDWVPYDDWPNYLLEADVGVSLHFDSLETHLAFRSRVLDYVQAGLPMVVATGDSTSEMVSGYGLGIVVPCGSVEDVATAILTLLDEPRDRRQEQFAEARAAFAWEQGARPLVAFCRAPHKAADHQAGIVEPALRKEEPFSQVIQLAGKLEAQETEIARLRTLVRGYERGRFVRCMRWLKRWRHRALLR